MSRDRRRVRRGLATPMALALTAVAAAALLSVVALLAFDVRRTRRSLVEAELRQLLVCGTDIAGRVPGPTEDSLRRDRTIAVGLPKVLREAGARLQIVWLAVDDTDGGGAKRVVRRCRVEATLREASAAQLLVSERVSESSWRLADVQAVQPSPASSSLPAQPSPSDNEGKPSP